MGSFSAACGITRLSITVGDKCVLIPLIAQDNGRRRKGGLKMAPFPYVEYETSALMVYNTDMWQPALLPIHGEYNDYGSIEEIVKDDNTEALEEYYGLPIETIVALITEGRRDIYDIYSEFCSVFFMYKEYLENDDALGLLKAIGVTSENKDGSLELKSATVLICDDGNKITVDYHDGKELCEYSSFRLDNFIRDYASVLKDERFGIRDYEKYHELLCIGGMFILEDVYEYFAKPRIRPEKNIVEDFDFNEMVLGENGFLRNEVSPTLWKKEINGQIIFVDSEEKTINKTSFYSMKDFITGYKKETGCDFDVSQYVGIDYYQWRERVFLSSYYSKLVKAVKYIISLKDDSVNINFENREEVIRYFIENKRFSFCLSELLEGFFTNKNFKKVYLIPMIQEKCIKQYFEFERLSLAMNLLNSVFIPSFAGTQCGCLEAEKKLTHIMNQIVEKRENERREWGNYDEVDVEEGFNDRFY